MDTKKAIAVLNDQIKKLDEKGFDLNAWKNYTIILLDRIFGKGNQKVEAIQKIKYDQGSWVLRDETGYTNSIEACKKMGLEVLEAAITELDAFGLPDYSASTLDINILMNALHDELTGSQFREIKKALSEEGQIEDKKKILITKLKSYGADTAFAIVANILSNDEVSDQIRHLN